MSESVEALKARGGALFADGDIEGALSTYERALEACTDSTATELRVALLLNASLLRLKRGDGDEALAHARLAVSFAPSNAKAHYRAACALLQCGDLDKAKSEAEFARKLAPKSEDTKRLCESVDKARRERHVQNAREEAKRSVDAHRTSTDLLSQIEDVISRDAQHKSGVTDPSEDDVELMEWRDDVWQTCLAIVREYREMEEMLIQRIRAGRAVDVEDIDSELKEWEKALPLMEPLEKLKLADDLAEMRRTVESTARSAELGEVPTATKGVFSKMTTLLDEIIDDAKAHGTLGQDVWKIAEQIKKELAAFEHKLDFSGCLERIDNAIFNAVGAKPLDSGTSE